MIYINLNKSVTKKGSKSFTNIRSFSVLAGGSLCNTVRNVERLPVLFVLIPRYCSTNKRKTEEAGLSYK